MTDFNTPKIIIISGPSGSGKGTVISALPEMYKKTISYTTRDIRSDIEQDGVHYFFVSPEEFDRLRKSGDIIEFNYFDGNYYGTSRTQITDILAQGYNVVLDVDVHGAFNIKKEYPEALMIFLMSPNAFIQEERLRRREKNTEESILNRIREAVNELKYAGLFDCIIINEEENSGKAAQAVLSYINEKTIPDKAYTGKCIADYFYNYTIKGGSHDLSVN
ncbi:MAG: guanylate kinase [Eubacteriales bacterium]|nr:guanylate kinase [Eubacteriales bacterium]